MGNKKNKSKRQSGLQRRKIAKLHCSKLMRDEKGSFLKKNNIEEQQPSGSRSPAFSITLAPVDLQPTATMKLISPNDTDTNFQNVPSSVPEPVADFQANLDADDDGFIIEIYDKKDNFQPKLGRRTIDKLCKDIRKYSSKT